MPDNKKETIKKKIVKSEPKKKVVQKKVSKADEIVRHPTTDVGKLFGIKRRLTAYGFYKQQEKKGKKG